MATLSQIVQRCVTRLGMVGGTGVQVYAEDILAEMVQARFDAMFESMWWNQYMVGEVAPLVIGGVIGADALGILGINRFTDIKHVYYSNDTKPLALVPGRLNATNYMKQDSRPRFIEPIAGSKVFRLLPFGTVDDTVYVVFRRRPETFQPDSDILLDDQALIYGTCYDYLEDDGTNPGATEKMRNFYNERLEQLNSSRNEQDIDLMPDEGKIPDYWQII